MKVYSSIPLEQDIDELLAGIKMQHNYFVDDKLYTFAKIDRYPTFEFITRDGTISSHNVWCWPVNMKPTHEDIKPAIFRTDINHLLKYDDEYDRVVLPEGYRELFNVLEFRVPYRQSTYTAIEDVTRGNVVDYTTLLDEREPKAEDKLYSSIPANEDIHDLVYGDGGHCQVFYIDGQMHYFATIPKYPNHDYIDKDGELHTRCMWCWPISVKPTPENVKPAILRLDLEQFLVYDSEKNPYALSLPKNIRDKYNVVDIRMIKAHPSGTILGILMQRYIVIEDVLNGNMKEYHKHLDYKGVRYE